MALPSKTIELIEQIAEKLERWVKGWGERLLKNRPHNLRQFRQSLLGESESAGIPQVAFKMQFHSGLDEALEGFDYVREELQHYMPNMAEMVQKKHDDLIIKAKSIGQITTNDFTWLKKFNNSRNSAKDLANTLRHIVEINKRELIVGKTKVNIELNLAERLLIIGTDKCRISSEFVWDFLKTLVCNIKVDQITPRIDRDRNRKNAVDVLRRKIGNDALHQVVTFTKSGYYLAASVKIKYSSQVGIRRTKTKGQKQEKKT